MNSYKIMIDNLTQKKEDLKDKIKPIEDEIKNIDQVIAGLVKILPEEESKSYKKICMKPKERSKMLRGYICEYLEKHGITQKSVLVNYIKSKLGDKIDQIYDSEKKFDIAVNTIFNGRKGFVQIKRGIYGLPCHEQEEYERLNNVAKYYDRSRGLVM